MSRPLADGCVNGHDAHHNPTNAHQPTSHAARKPHREPHTPNRTPARLPAAARGRGASSAGPTAAQNPASESLAVRTGFEF